MHRSILAKSESASENYQRLRNVFVGRTRSAFVQQEGSVGNGAMQP